MSDQITGKDSGEKSLSKSALQGKKSSLIINTKADLTLHNKQSSEMLLKAVSNLNLQSPNEGYFKDISLIDKIANYNSKNTG